MPRPLFPSGCWICRDFDCIRKATGTKIVAGQAGGESYTVLNSDLPILPR